MLLPVTRRIAQGVLDGGPITRTFEEGSRHDRIAQAMGIAIRDIDSGAAVVLPAVWLIVRRADGRILGDLGGPRPARQPGLRRDRLQPRPVRPGPGQRHRRRGRLRRAPSGGSGNPPDYCCPWKADQLAKAIHVLQARQTEG